MGKVLARAHAGKRDRSARDELGRRASNALAARPDLKAVLPRLEGTPKPYDRDRERLRNRRRKPASFEGKPENERVALSAEERREVAGLRQHLHAALQWGWESEADQERFTRAKRIMGSEEQRFERQFARVARTQWRFHALTGDTAANAATVILNAMSIAWRAHWSPAERKKLAEFISRSTWRRGGGVTRKISVARAVREFLAWRRNLQVKPTS